jgi:hypothetical protein
MKSSAKTATRGAAGRTLVGSKHGKMEIRAKRQPPVKSGRQGPYVGTTYGPGSNRANGDFA